MNYFTDKEIFYVDSHNRIDQTDSNSDFTYELDIDPTHDYDHVTLLDISLPKSSYVINSSNNTFVVEENSVQRLITLPVGNYNRTSYKNVLKLLLNVSVDYVYDITFQNSNRTQDNGKYTFTVVTILPAMPQPLFIFQSGLYEQMGFNKNTSYTFVGDSLESIGVTNFRPESTYYILSNICQNRGNGILQNIISSGSDDFNFISFHNPNPNEYSKKFIRTRSNVFKFLITDEDFHRVDLNGLNVVFTLMLYRKNDIDRLLKGFIKLQTLKQTPDDDDVEDED
jgi:hypothetical protein